MVIVLSSSESIFLIVEVECSCKIAKREKNTYHIGKQRGLDEPTHLRSHHSITQLKELKLKLQTKRDGLTAVGSRQAKFCLWVVRWFFSGISRFHPT